MRAGADDPSAAVSAGSPAVAGPPGARDATESRSHRDTALLLLLTAVLLAVFLLPVFQGTLASGFPLDDGWIHAVYARNLAEGGEFALNAGQPSTGTTSLLWTLLLAAAHATGLGAVPAAWMLGGASLLLAVGVWHRLLLLQGFSRAHSALSAAALPLSGIALWWTLSGMETVLFLSLSVFAFHSYTRGAYTFAGVWIALLVLARPEGALLAPVLAFAAWRRERSLRPALTLLAVSLAGVLLYLLWNLAVSGTLWTSTLGGRRWLALGGEDADGGPVAYLTAFASMLGRWLRTLFWGMLRWAPPVLWIAAAAAMADLLLVPLLKRRPRRHARTRLQPGPVAAADARIDSVAGSDSDTDARSNSGDGTVLFSLLAWTAMHAAAYAALLPYPGHAGRYLAPLLLLASALLAQLLRRRFGDRRLGERRPGDSRFDDGRAGRGRSGSGNRVLPATLLVAVAVAVSVASISSWSVAWRGAVAHIDAVHCRAAEWVRARTDSEARVACYDIGAMAYFSGRHVIDLGGLTDPSAVPFMRGRIDEYILFSRADYVAMVAPYEGLAAPGFIPFALGHGRSGLFSAVTVAEFHITPEAYRLHIGITGNAYPRIIVEKRIKS